VCPLKIHINQPKPHVIANRNQVEFIHKQTAMHAWVYNTPSVPFYKMAICCGEMAIRIASGREKGLARDEMAMGMGSIYSPVLKNLKLNYLAHWRPWDSLH
jgi:hypothetical protein